MKKYTLLVTQECNLRCSYCYVNKINYRMPFPIAKKVIDFAFSNTSSEEKIDIGFFGGEPLLEFNLLKDITTYIEDHPSYERDRSVLSITTNGTIFSDEIAEFLRSHSIGFCVSCDGPRVVHDLFRRYPTGEGSSVIVEKNIRRALDVLPWVVVNAVYHPKTFQYLPEVIEYFSSLGLRQIYLNPDFSAPWSKNEAELLKGILRQVGDLYMKYYLQGKPHFISFIDSKITVILRGGYQPHEKCQMGKREFAFSPQGNIFLCERLVGSGDYNKHCLGNIEDGLNIGEWTCQMSPDQSLNPECLACSLKNYCMNWCGCSNYFATGYYHQVSPFLCASEKASIQVAFEIFQKLEEQLGPTFMEHLSGSPFLNSRLRSQGDQYGENPSSTRAG
jgi:uncharacterized protein